MERPDANSGIPFFLGSIKIASVVFKIFYFMIELIRLRFCFLDTKHVGHFFPKPFRKTFLPDGSDTVYVPAKYPEFILAVHRFDLINADLTQLFPPLP